MTAWHVRAAAMLLTAVVASVWSGDAHAQDVAPLVLTPDAAVALALEHNLALTADRLTPQLGDQDVARVRTAWTPSTFSRVSTFDATAPAASVLATAQPTTVDTRRAVEVGLDQRLPWGMEYRVGWSGATHSSTNVFSRFNPELTSGLTGSIVQPLLKGFGADPVRADLKIARLTRERDDADLDAAIATTARLARRSFWEWSAALDLLTLQTQSLELARTLLRENRARVQAGAMAAVDIIEAEAEVARRDEAILIAEKNVANAADALRRVLLDPASPSFGAPFERGEIALGPIPVSDNLLERALERRHELRTVKKTLQADVVTIDRLAADSRPDLALQVDYVAQSAGGTELLRGTGFPGPVIGTARRSFGATIGDVWNNSYPTWSVQLSFSRPLGLARSEAELAHATLQRRQNEIHLRDAELTVRTEVAAAVRGLQTNRRRIESTATAVALAERRLDAEQRKFTSGLSTSFFVFQAQRDLSTARESAIRALFDYRVTEADVEAVQVIPLATVSQSGSR